MPRLIYQPQNDPENYHYFNNAFSKEEIKKIISDCDSLPDVNRATTEDGEQKSEDGGLARTSMIKWIPETEKWHWLYDKLLDLAIKANKEKWRFDLVSSLELIQYTEYHASECGQYDWHQDVGEGDLQSKRKVSITVQLSDDDEYEGGEFMILKGGSGTGKLENFYTCPRNKGNVIIFPSYKVHRVAPVTKGVRKSLVLWIGGSHFR